MGFLAAAILHAARQADNEYARWRERERIRNTRG
jgi:hypothetical protein